MLDYLVFAVLWIILSLLGEYAAYIAGSHFYYFVASTQGEDGQRAAQFILYVAVPIFMFIVLMLIFSWLRFRNWRQEPGNSKIQTKFNKIYVSVWIAVSLFVNLFLFIHPTASAQQEYFNDGIEANKSSDTLEVDIVARQWEWFYSYPQYGISQAVDDNGNDILVLPKGRAVKFVLRSYDPRHTYNNQVDVIHSFWIPAFGIKTDVIPGETRYEYITPTEITSTDANPMARVQCAEVCGPGHPFMETPMKVVSADDFAKWIQKEKKLQGS